MTDQDKNLFFTLCVVRVANLSGAKPRPVTMGGYRNFVRQYAQEFGDPTLGEEDEHILLDPMLILWKKGCLELKKDGQPYSNATGIQWLVGRGSWTMLLTPEGRALRADVEERAKALKKNAIGFHA